MSRLLTLAALFLFSTSVQASPCIAFDSHWNLLAFGFGGKDWNAGTRDTWASGQPKEITASGRPPFDGVGTTCYLAQFQNAIYVLNGDAASPSSVHIYDASAASWSTQSVDPGKFDPKAFTTILDHDTNVFYALSKGSIYSLSMTDQVAAKPEALTWAEQQSVPFATDEYKPVMAIAKNHIHFLNVPGLAPGTARIFVIHYSYMQPEPQNYGEPAFPATHGQVASFFKDQGPQLQFAFIPDDGSGVYVVDVDKNTTQALPAPSTKDAAATYFASTDALVQLTPSGAISYIPYTGDASGSWSQISSLSSITTAAVSSGGSNNSNNNSTNGNSSASSAPTKSAGGSSPTSSSAAGSNAGNGAEAIRLTLGPLFAAGLISLATLL